MTMEARFELIDYEDREKAYDNPRLVITDANFDYDMVRIRFGDDERGYKTVKVDGKELIKAVERCMRCNYPYI